MADRRVSIPAPAPTQVRLVISDGQRYATVAVDRALLAGGAPRVTITVAKALRVLDEHLTALAGETPKTEEAS
jgi:hypothetical protein